MATKRRRALVSVSDKTGLVDLAKGLVEECGFEIVSTGGTFKVLKDAGVSPLIEVADVTGFPEGLGGRVKTLHPKVHAGILAERGNVSHMQYLMSHGIVPVDLVVVNLYPFETAAQKKDVTVAELIENIDIGGPTMIRGAAKNWQDVAVLVEPGQYPAYLALMKEGKGKLPPDYLWNLARLAFARIAAYDKAITMRLANIEVTPKGEVNDFRDSGS